MVEQPLARASIKTNAAGLFDAYVDQANPKGLEGIAYNFPNDDRFSG